MAIDVLDFSSASLAIQPVSTTINDLIEKSEPPSENYRQYLGASAVGVECLRRVQFDWMCDPVFPARTKDIFARGHFFEEVSRQRLVSAGFKFAPKERLEFTAVDGLFRGHADGILISGPELPAIKYPALWECKCLKNKGWHAIERDGLTGLYAIYAAQVAIYQAYLNCTNPALFTVVNADNAERLHFLVPFDAALAQNMSDRAVSVIEATKAGELLPRITTKPDDWRCKMCGHRERCWRLS